MTLEDRRLEGGDLDWMLSDPDSYWAYHRAHAKNILQEEERRIKTRQRRNAAQARRQFMNRFLFWR